MDAEMNGETAQAVRTEAPSATDARVSTWQVSTAALAFVVAALLWLYWDAAVAAVSVWYGSPTFNHGFIVLPVVAYLIYERRSLLRGAPPSPFLWALPLVAGSGIVWLFAYAIGIIEAQQFALLFMVQSALLALLGLRLYRALLFPLLFLFFLVPSGEFLVPGLQDFTAEASVGLLRISGIPVFSDGVFISIPNGNFYVAEACAGLRFLIATIAFGFLFAELTYRSWWRRALFIGLCIVTPVAANALRAYGIIIIAHLSDNQLAAGVDHLVYGWFFFSFVTVGLAAAGLTFRDGGPDYPRMPARPGMTVQDARLLAGAAILVVALIAMPRAYASYVEARSARPVAADILKLPEAVAPWSAVEAGDSWRPVFPRADATLLQAYRDGKRTVRVFVAYYRDQDQQKKLIHSINRPDGEEWTIVSRGNVALTVDGRRIDAAATRLANRGAKRLMVSWYWIGDEYTARTLKAKLLGAKAAFIDRRPEGAWIALAADYTDTPEEAERAIADFVATMPPLEPLLQAAAR